MKNPATHPRFGLGWMEMQGRRKKCGQLFETEGRGPDIPNCRSLRDNDTRMNTRRALILLALATALAVLVLVWPNVRLFFQVDACLDSGGRWNYQTDSCEHSP